MTDKQTIERIMGLRAQAERAAKDMASLDAKAELAEQRVIEIEDNLRQHGFDPAGDLMGQLDSEAAGVEVEITAIGTSLAEVKARAGAPPQQ